MMSQGNQTVKMTLMMETLVDKVEYNDEMELNNAIESTDKEDNTGIYIHFGTLIVTFASPIVFLKKYPIILAKLEIEIMQHICRGNKATSGRLKNSFNDRKITL